MHTPYNRRTYRGGVAAETYPGFALRLVQHGYHVAVVDFRGVYASFGQNRAYNRGEWLDAARMDAYDVTEWFAKQPWSNGRIGMWGCSATGGSQMQAATTAPPSLKAIFPMSAEFDAYSFQVNGGVAPPPGAPLRALPGPAVRDKGAVAVDGADGPALLQQAIAGHLADGDAIGDVPFRDSVSRPLGETWWLKSSPHTYLDTLRKSGIGIYAVANWDEAGTKHGAFFTFANLRGQARLLVGPAPHCGWTQVKTDTGFDIVSEELRFFDYWLKGVRNGVMEEPAVTYYTYNAPREQAWRRAASWPLPNEVRTTFYLGDGTLGRDKPAGGGEGCRRLQSTRRDRDIHDRTTRDCRREHPLLSDADSAVRHGSHRTSGDASLDHGGRAGRRYRGATGRCRAGWERAVVQHARPVSGVAPRRGRKLPTTTSDSRGTATRRRTRNRSCRACPPKSSSRCCRCLTSSRRAIVFA